MKVLTHTDGNDDTLVAGRCHNFSAGPGVLPLSVLEEVAAELPVYRTAGASVMEISHRSAEYTELADSARAAVRRLLKIDDQWHILFLQGGASLQFYQAALNFLPKAGRASYVITGSWAKKAAAEAKRVGSVHVAASSEDRNFGYVPDVAQWDVAPDSSYIHVTSNNTIFGTQYQTDPDTTAPLVCDASSDFLSRPVDMSKYGLVYAGAQKNVGPAGVTVVLVHDEFLKRANDDVPTMLDYRTHATKLFNTPPVFAVYVVEKVLRWLEAQGGLTAIHERNRKKASSLYARIDATDFYKGTADVAARSLMNVTFRLTATDLEAVFIEEAKKEGLVSLKGHRSVGGIRASIYNACPPESVAALVSFMNDFENRYG
jgi:phosphoserine aminotransferase